MYTRNDRVVTRAAQDQAAWLLDTGLRLLLQFPGEARQRTELFNSLFHAWRSAAGLLTEENPGPRRPWVTGRPPVRLVPPRQVMGDGAPGFDDPAVTPIDTWENTSSMVMVSHILMKLEDCRICGESNIVVWQRYTAPDFPTIYEENAAAASEGRTHEGETRCVAYALCPCCFNLWITDAYEYSDHLPLDCACAPGDGPA